MEFLIWMAIGVALMAVELVVPGGSIVCRTGINSLVNCHYHRVL